MRTKNILFTGVLGLLLLVTGNSYAQKAMKIGYTSPEYIMFLHPKTKEVESKLAAHQKQYEKLIQEKVAEFQGKYQSYEKGASMMTEIQRADKERELQSLQGRIEQMQKDADSDLQKKQVDLMQPVLDQIQKAIDAVRTENGYTYIFSSNAGGANIILSGPEADNVTNLILKKIGVDPPKEN